MNNNYIILQIGKCMTLTNMKNNRMGSIEDKKEWKEMPEALGWAGLGVIYMTWG